jgi:hypothetical protein
MPMYMHVIVDCVCWMVKIMRHEMRYQRQQEVLGMFL